MTSSRTLLVRIRIRICIRRQRRITQARNRMGDFSWLARSEITQDDDRDPIIDVPCNVASKTLPGPTMLNDLVPVDSVHSPRKAIMIRVRFAVVQWEHSPHALQTGSL